MKRALVVVGLAVLLLALLVYWHVISASTFGLILILAAAVAVYLVLIRPNLKPRSRLGACTPVMRSASKVPVKHHQWAWLLIVLLVFVAESCSVLSHLENLCNCLPLLPDISDYRHNAKHVPIPGGTPVQITVNTILSWPETPILPPEQPRFGQELQLVQIQLAYLQNATVNPSDCDIHLEISQTADKHAPRVIIETPVDSEYCANRQYVQSHLKQQGFQLDTSHGGELARPLPVSVLGLPFEDFEHPDQRGTALVASLWEIHPAVITFL